MRARRRQRWLSSPAGRVAAEENGILAGFAIAQSGRLRRIAIGNIVTLDVDPAFRRRGIGRLLMHHLEREMARAGAACLRLEVAVDNPGAQSFYARLGFEPIGQIRGYYHANLDAIVMEKTPAGSVALIA